MRDPPVTALSPLETLYDATTGRSATLPPDLAALYGPLLLPLAADRPHVVANFVTALDGVVALNAAGHQGGGPISGYNAHDRLVMGLLRAVADAVVVGAGTLRSVPQHLWTAEHIFPAMAPAYRDLRMTLAKSEQPLTVIVTARGELDLRLPVFQAEDIPVLIVTTAAGRERLGAGKLPPATQVVAAGQRAIVSARAVVNAVQEIHRSDTILVEGGPQLMGDFVSERCLHDLFLTLAPQIAGRGEGAARPGLVAGREFAPNDPRWGTLVGVKRGASHLFLRYAFAAADDSAAPAP